MEGDVLLEATSHTLQSKSYCLHCGGSCLVNGITLTLKRNASEYAIVRNVPAEVCQVCGESQFTLPTSIGMLTTIGPSRKPDDFMIVPIYDFGE